MLKWPNLYYSTSAFAPQHYPKEIIDYANTRGADKIIYAGLLPDGAHLERIFGDMPTCRFKDDVWPKFLRENARQGAQALLAHCAPRGHWTHPPRPPTRAAGSRWSTGPTPSWPGSANGGDGTTGRSPSRVT